MLSHRLSYSGVTRCSSAVFAVLIRCLDCIASAVPLRDEVVDFVLQSTTSFRISSQIDTSRRGPIIGSGASLIARLLLGRVKSIGVFWRFYFH